MFPHIFIEIFIKAHYTTNQCLKKKNIDTTKRIKGECL